MKQSLVLAGMLSLILLTAHEGRAEKWVKINFDVPNKNLKANYYDTKSVKVRNNTIYWTEKFILTDFGSEQYTKYLKKFPECAKNIETMGSVTHHKLDFEIRDGKYRTVAKRNYTGKEQLVCTDREMGSDLDTKWYEVEYRTPMYERHYRLVTKHKLVVK